MPLLFDFGSTNLSTILLEMLYRVPGIIVAISFHECAHAYAAYKCGDPTARNLGRMTLNPLAHFDPIGIVMMLLVRFGWAKPVPINTRNFKNPRKDELIVSLAGVATNLIIAFLTLGVMYILQVFTTVDSVILDNILSSMFFLNLAFFVFNLLPVPPLDGYHVLQCIFVHQCKYRLYERNRDEALGWHGRNLFSHFQPVPVSVEPWHMKSISASLKVR